MTPIVKRRLAGFAIALAVFALDQWVKWFVVKHFHLGSVGDSVDLLPFFALTRTHNYGVSLGMFTAHSTEMQLALIGITGAIALGVAVWILRERKMGDIVALSLVLGGALGNILDRLTNNYVLDYADLHFGEIRPFLIFNVADAAITIGVLIVLARSLFMREKPAHEQSPPETETAPDAAETN
ncbi:signal peptidase II [Altererythrobacter salegens]|uniref:Lipoprotein signal peptidase n=1 Tax=Croceibacterium salegens TaxID=1737568 RepID=A0A6I4SXL0_9SPHN|nr:signal peptidase II [Croceibacterium salegens]MXO60593.1 signal peptidase II [Croceibacterium salegens]